jgi:MFS family permease
MGEVEDGLFPSGSAPLRGRAGSGSSAIRSVENVSDGRGWVFVYVLFVNFFMTADYSVFPAAINIVKDELELSDTEIGGLGSTVYFGLMLGSVCAGPLLSWNPHRCVQLALLASGCSTLLTAIAWNKAMLFAARFLVGVMHAPMYVYASVWVDNFAPTGVETRWMGMLSTIGPLGNLASYAITATMVFGLNLSWRFAFGYICVIVFGSAFALSLVPRELWQAQDTSGAHHGAGGFRALAPYASFWLLCLVPCCAYYSSCGAQYWAERMLIHHGVPEKEAPLKFLTVGILGPTAGMALGGPLIDCFGGYRQRKRAMMFCLVCIFCSFPFGPSLLYPDDVDTLMGAVLCSMFFFGLVLPAVTGLVMDSVPLHQKPHASAVFGILIDSLGFMLAPTVMGAATQAWGIESGWRMGFWPALGSPLLLIGAMMWEWESPPFDASDSETEDFGESGRLRE